MSRTSIVALLIGILLSFGLFQLRVHQRRTSQNERIQYFQQMVSSINQSPETRWKARLNPSAVRKGEMDIYEPRPRNASATEEYLDRVENYFRSEAMQKHLRELKEFPDSQLPSNFDSRLKWSLCRSLHWVPNQGACGSCYANAAVGVASDRTCIATNGKFNSLLSVDEVMGCCQVCGDCLTGGDELKVLTFWTVEGLVTGGPDGCRPDNFPKDCGTPCKMNSFYRGEELAHCGPPECQTNYYKKASYEEDKHYGSLAYAITPRRTKAEQKEKEERKMPSIVGHFSRSPDEPLSAKEVWTLIKKELFLYGPVTMDFPVTEEFLHYDSGVFHPYPAKEISNRIVYTHVVRIIGWGRSNSETDGGDYWLAVNTHGTEWGEHGLFRFDPSILIEQGFKLEVHAGITRD